LDSGSVFLEAPPPEVDPLQAANLEVVTARWIPPEGGEAQYLTMTVEAFAGIVSAETLATAQPFKAPRRSSPDGSEINYATLEYAGRPHRGKVSDEEARFVREHLSEVNARLTQEGKRLIDPTNPEHKEQYGFLAARGSVPAN
jgi:hypothetical protein